MPVASDTPAVSDVQKRLEELGPSDDKYRPLLRELLGHQDLKTHIHGLDRPGLEGFVELLDGVSVRPISTSTSIDLAFD